MGEFGGIRTLTGAHLGPNNKNIISVGVSAISILAR